MLPQSRQSKSTVSARSFGVVYPGLSILTDTYDRQYFGSVAYTSVAKSFEVDQKTPNCKESDETAIVAHGEDGKVDRPTTPIPEGIAPNRPNPRTSLAHVGPRPLLLGTYKIATSSPTTSSRSRPSSSSLAPRTPAIPSARWSSYTTPLTPLSKRSPSTVSDEVEVLKAQLAASEAVVKQLMKEKSEAAVASQRLYLTVTSLRKKQSQWLKEREELMTKLRLLDEVNASPELSPPTGGAWFAGSNQEQHPPSKPSNPISPTRISGPEHDLGIAPPEARQDAEVTLSRPAASDAPSQPVVSEMCDTGSEFYPGSSADEDVLARIGSVFRDSTTQADGCDPGTSTPLSFFTIDSASTSLNLREPPRAYRRFRHHRNAIEGSQSTPPIVKDATLPLQTPLSTSPPRASLKAPEFSCVPGNLPPLLVRPPVRSVSASAQAHPLRPNLIDLASKVVGSEAYPGYSRRQEPKSGAKSFPKDTKAAAGSRPSINLATGVELHAPMARVSTSTGRPRIASGSPSWRERTQPQIQLHPRPPLDEGFATIEGHATVSLKPKHRKPSPLRMRGFVPRSSPLANPPEDANEAQPRARGLMPYSSPQVDTTPENAPGAQPKKRTQLRKLFRQAKSWISRVV